MYGMHFFQNPLVAAQVQFRERYYGLAAAAMLEDLFFDSLASFLSTHHPGVSLARPPRGEKGYDYEIEGERVSHKVSKAGAIQIAALWDATRTDVTSWSFDFPICFNSGGYSRLRFKVLNERSSKRSVLMPLGVGSKVSPGEGIVVGRWQQSNAKSSRELVVHDTIAATSSGELCEIYPFSSVWSLISKLAEQGVPANEIEVFMVSQQYFNSIEKFDTLTPVEEVYPPGTYVFTEDKLQNIEVEHNNRAILVPKRVVADLMSQAIGEGSFVPLTTWFSAYAGTTPPDLYLVQRRAYDEFFSIYTRRG